MHDTDASERLHFRRGRRVPMVRQTEAAECGLACVAMVAGYHGHHVGLVELRQRFPSSAMGARLSDLMVVAQSLGLASRAIRIEISELAQVTVPCILHWDMDHFVVLVSVHKGHVVVHDPALGKRVVTWKECSERFTGVALELSQTPQFQRKRAEPPLSLWRLAGRVDGISRALLNVFAMALLLELLALAAPQFLQVTVDQVLADGDKDLLALIGLAFITLLVVQAAASAARTWMVTWVTTNFNLAWTGNVFQHLMRLPQDYFLKRSLGDIVSRFGAITTIQQTLSTQFVTAAIDGLMGAVTLAVLFAYSPLLTGLTLLAILFYGVIRLLYFRVLREANLSQIVVNARQQGAFLEAVRGVQIIRLFGRSSAETSRYLNVTADALNTGTSIQRLNVAFSALGMLTNGAQRVTVLWLGAWLGLKGDFTAGMLMAFVAYSDQFSARSSALVDFLVQLRLLRLQGERLADIVLAEPERFVDRAHVGEAPEPSIRFEHVYYRYGPHQPWVVEDCSFDIPANQVVAITGESGSGKSTLVRLMLGLLDPERGRILIGGIDIRHLGKAAYRSMVASVMQDDQLFSGTVADNIAFFDEAANMDDIQTASRMAQLHDDLTRMPMGYHTRVGDMGSGLSGGQQQRLLLARALYRKPSILVLDEATSHLDARREAAICHVLDQLDCTRVMIAHRKETIELARTVLTMRNGTVHHTTQRPAAITSGFAGFTAPAISQFRPAPDVAGTP